MQRSFSVSCPVESRADETARSVLPLEDPGKAKTRPDRISAGRTGFLSGAREGIRTPNLLIRSQMLYPLSYARI